MSPLTVGSLFLATGLLASSPGPSSQSVVATAVAMSAVSGCEGLPSSLVVDPQLRPLILELRRRAPTFRRQVMRLVDQPNLVVTVGTWRLRTTESAGARTRFTMDQGRVRAADVEIRVDAAVVLVELVGHEFEHILEQLDGIDLTRWIGRSGVHRAAGSRDDAIETERARRTGRIVAGEYAAARSTTPSCGPRS